MISKYIVKVELVVAVISLFTIVVLMILNTLIPEVLMWIFATSLILTLATSFYVRKYKTNSFL